MGSLKNCNINRKEFEEKLNDAVLTFFGDNAKIQINNQPKNKQCIITYQNNDYKLNIFYNKDGTTSFTTIGSPTTHNRTDSFIKELVDRFGISKKKNFSFSIQHISDSDLSSLYDYVENDLGATKIFDEDTPTGVMKKYKAQTEDIVTITRYHNGNTLFQGKPLYLYANLCDFLSSFCSAADIIMAQKELHNIELDETYIQNQYNARLSNVTSFLGEDIKDILLPAFSLMNVEIELTDYSLFVYPALRGLEGYIKQLFRNKSITIDNKKNEIGNYFTPQLKNFVLKPEYRSTIGDTKTVDALGKLYTLYHNERNSLFHTDAIAPRLIEKREEADSIVNSVIDLIEQTYIDINS